VSTGWAEQGLGVQMKEEIESGDGDDGDSFFDVSVMRGIVITSAAAAASECSGSCSSCRWVAAVDVAWCTAVHDDILS